MISTTKNFIYWGKLITIMKFQLIFCLLLAITFISCDDDADASMDMEQETLLTGVVRGIDFTYGSGRVVDFGNEFDEYTIRIDNAGPMVTDSCTTNSDDAYIRLDVDRSLGLGQRDLFFDNSTGDGITVIFHHPDIFQNLIVSSGGWYNIISKTDDEVEIEFDIDAGEDNNLKGSCIVYRCN